MRISLRAFWPLFIVAAALGFGRPLAAAEATHSTTQDVVVRGEHGETLQTFCLGADGKLFALLAQPVSYGAEKAARSSGGGEVRVLDADGKTLGSWSVDFAPQRLGAGPEGDVVVGGSGKLARFSPDGKLLASAESPHLATVLADKEALRAAAEEQHRGSIESYTEQLKQFEEQAKELEARIKKEEAANEAEKKKDGAGKNANSAKKRTTSGFAIFSIFSDGAAPTAEEPESNAAQQLQMMRQMSKTYRQMLESEQKRTIEDVMRDITTRLQRIHGVAVGKNEVYVATAMAKGYGYAVWRMTKDFQDAKQIISGLSGCCGQIDVQCRGEQLFVAENSRHRVVSYDREGKRLEAWGKRDRDGEGGGFGGCCNPMNLCFLSGGDVVTSESEGLVKRFSPAGDFLGLIGKAKVSGGCKNVAVAASADGRRIYFYDLQGSKIIILTQTAAAKPDPAATTTNAK